MNIMLINTAYSGGGAEKVTRQIAQVMEERGHNVYIVVGYNEESVDRENVTVLYDGIVMRILNRIITDNHSNASLNVAFSLKQILHIIKKKNIDIVHLNNIHGNYLGIRDVEQISKQCPVIWTIHDFWSFTGHCAYTYGCNAWKTGCGNCSNLNVYPELKKDITDILLAEKTKAFCHKGIKFVSPSVWLSNQMKESILNAENIKVINNSLDFGKWKILDKGNTRRKLNINSSKIVLAFVAASISEPRKGVQYLIDALNQLENPEKYQLLVAGNDKLPELQKLKNKYDVRFFGYINDESKMNEFFAAADYFVNPSTEDIFGLVNIEALASGTHVIAFDICAINEIVDCNSGIKVKKLNATALAEAISEAPKILCDVPRISVCFEQNYMADKYENLYIETIQEWKNKKNDR